MGMLDFLDKPIKPTEEKKNGAKVIPQKKEVEKKPFGFRYREAPKRFQGFRKKMSEGIENIPWRKQNTALQSYISRIGVGTEKGTGITRRKEGGKKGSTRYFLPGGATYRVAKRQYQSKGKGVGRPRMSFKQRFHPITGQPVGFMPALQWYKVKRRIISQAKAAEEIALMRAQGQMPQQRRFQAQTMPQTSVTMPQVQRFPVQPTQSIPPQFQRRMPERFVTHRDAFMRPRNMPVQRAPPGQIPEGVSRVRINGQIFKVITDIASGKRRLVPGSQVLY